MPRDTLTPPDNGASYMGRFGLKNEMVCWLIGRGQGELVALRPEEMQLMAPRCPRPRCGQTMRYRAGYWACYFHKPAVKVSQELQVQKMPAFSGCIEDALDDIIDMEYSSERPGAPARWRYVRRPMAPRRLP